MTNEISFVGQVIANVRMIMQGLFKYQNKIFTKKDVKDALKLLGINTGDIVCMHTDMFNLGVPICRIKEFLNILLGCFYEALGESGTLIMPTFTYSFCDGLVYDKQKSRTRVGSLNEFFRKQPNVARTNDPIFSFAVWGAKKDLFLKDVDSCFGAGSVYDEFIKAGGKYVFFGTQFPHTMLHCIEEEFGVRYRYHKEFSGTLIDEFGKEHQKSIKYFVRRLDMPTLLNTSKVNEIVCATPSFNSVPIGNTHIWIFDAIEYKDAIVTALKQDEQCLLDKTSSEINQ